MSEPKTYRIRIEPLRWEASDPVSAEHELVSRLVSETLKSGWQCYTELDLNLIDAGKGILKAGPETSARIVLALVAHAAHFDDLSRQARALAQNEMERINWHSFCPEWEAIWPARQVSAQALRRVMRRGRLSWGSLTVSSLTPSASSKLNSFSSISTPSSARDE